MVRLLGMSIEERLGFCFITELLFKLALLFSVVFPLFLYSLTWFQFFLFFDMFQFSGERGKDKKKRIKFCIERLIINSAELCFRGTRVQDQAPQ